MGKANRVSSAGRGGGRIGSYRHASASRPNLPTPQTEPLMDERDKAPVVFKPARRAPDEEPVLAWDRGSGSSSPGRGIEEADGDNGSSDETFNAYPIYVREKIHPEAFAASLMGQPSQSQLGLFKDFNGLPSEDAAFEWYRHEGNWQNRLIHGESARVMASMIEREHLAGQVQMIYFDPPYGIGFKSNFQVSTRKRESATGRKGLPCDPQTIQAFRDTYERGVHSYLDQMLSKLAMFRELLTDTGAVFVQIGDENVHRMAVLLDEVFGAENRMATIPYVTAGSSSSSTLPSVADFLLWYAKDKPQAKYHQLYESLDRAEKIKHMNWDAMVEFADGSTGKLTAEQRTNPDTYLPKGARVYRRMPLASPGTSTTGRSEPYHWNGRVYPCPPSEQWRVSIEGMDRLAELGRLDAADKPGSLLGWKRYEDEVPGRRINNVWHRQMSTSDKRYVVQTADSVIERCVLMSTDPGDLVFDPTCGGATTAMAAEKWGRRWITCDTSPVALAIARQRIATATFPYWKLADPLAADAAEVAADPARGFVCESVPRVSAAILAYDRKLDPLVLVDRPHSERSVVRLVSPFTVESSSPWSYLPLDTGSRPATTHSATAHTDFAKDVVEALLRSPVRTGNDNPSDLHITEIEPWPGRRGVISHLAVYTVGDGIREHRAGLLIAPEDATVSTALLRKAVLDAASSIDRVRHVIAVAFAFEPDTTDLHMVGSVGVVRVQMHRDLQIRDLKQDDEHHAFVMVGQPDIRVHSEDGGQVSVELRGYDTYDPATGNVRSGKADEVACWMIDTDHDGMSFYARRIHFPGAESDKQMKRLYKQLGASLDTIRWKAALSTRSAPFPRPATGEIAVQIITTTGMEMSLTTTVPPTPTTKTA